MPCIQCKIIEYPHYPTIASLSLSLSHLWPPLTQQLGSHLSFSKQAAPKKIFFLPCHENFPNKLQKRGHFSPDAHPHRHVVQTFGQLSIGHLCHLILSWIAGVLEDTYLNNT